MRFYRGTCLQQSHLAREKRLWGRCVAEPLANPTGKQKEAYARFFHTLSTGCFIGAVTVAFSGARIQVAVRAAVLILLGIVLFFVRATLAKGEVND